MSDRKSPEETRPYRAEVTAIGGRTGFVQSSDSRLRLELSRPSEQTDVREAGTNPEQLLAAAYASCFLAAIRNAARETDVTIPPDANVTARIEENPGQGAELAITLLVDLPGLKPSEISSLVDRAHAISRCSRAMRGELAVRTVTD